MEGFEFNLITPTRENVFQTISLLIQQSGILNSNVTSVRVWANEEDGIIMKPLLNNKIKSLFNIFDNCTSSQLEQQIIALKEK